MGREPHGILDRRLTPARPGIPGPRDHRHRPGALDHVAGGPRGRKHQDHHLCDGRDRGRLGRGHPRDPRLGAAELSGRPRAPGARPERRRDGRRALRPPGPGHARRPRLEDEGRGRVRRATRWRARRFSPTRVADHRRRGRASRQRRRTTASKSAARATRTATGYGTCGSRSAWRATSAAERSSRCCMGRARRSAGGGRPRVSPPRSGRPGRSRGPRGSAGRRSGPSGAGPRR